MMLMNNRYISNTRFNLPFVLSRKLLGRSPAAPFLCNFRANFAAAMSVSKGTNAGQANVRWTRAAARAEFLGIKLDLILKKSIIEL